MALSLVVIVLRLLARERRLVEQRVLAARDQTRMSLDAGDQMMGVAGDGETRERPESGGQRVRVHLGGTRETNDGCSQHRAYVIFHCSYMQCCLFFTFWVADLQQLIGPVASVNAFVVGQTGLAVMLMGLSEGALDVAGRALVAVWVDAEQILAGRRRDWRV